MSHLVKPVACVCTREFIRSLPAWLRLDLFLLQDNTYWEIKSESSVWASCCCWSFCSISRKVVLTWVKMLFSRSRIFDIFAVLLMF